jgi:thiamine biosynthesis protein ThiC
MEDTDYRGRITRVDSQMQRIKIEWLDKEGEEEYLWTSFWDILDIFE